MHNIFGEPYYHKTTLLLARIENWIIDYKISITDLVTITQIVLERVVDQVLEKTSRN